MSEADHSAFERRVARDDNRAFAAAARAEARRQAEAASEVRSRAEQQRVDAETAATRVQRLRVRIDRAPETP